MSLAIITVAGMAILTTAERVHAGVIVGLLIAVLSPLVSLIPPDFMPKIVRMYLVPDYNYFSYFPWAAFLAFGISAGSILRLVTEEHMHRLMQWAAILGFGTDHFGAVFFEPALFALPDRGFLAEQPGTDLHQAGRYPRAACANLPVDAPWLGSGLELGPATRNHFPAGVLGSH